MRRLYEVVGILARQLGMKPGRVQAIAGRFQDVGLLSRSEGSRRVPLDIGEPQITALIIAVLAEAGTRTSPEAAKTFGALTSSSDGQRFDLFLTDLLFGPPRHVRQLIVRRDPAGVTALVDNEHVLFGEPPSRTNASPARIVSGETIAAIAAELRGETETQAEAAAQMARLSLALGR